MINGGNQGCSHRRDSSRRRASTETEFCDNHGFRDGEPSIGGDLAKPWTFSSSETLAKRRGSLREENVQKGIEKGHDPKRNLQTLLFFLRFPWPISHDPLHIFKLGKPPLQKVVDTFGFMWIHFSSDGVSCASEALQVLESGSAVAEGPGGGPNSDPVHSGVEDERGELRSEQRASEWEEDEELECGDQVEASHLVLTL